MSIPPHKRKAPPIDDFLATVLNRKGPGA